MGHWAWRDIHCPHLTYHVAPIFLSMRLLLPHDPFYPSIRLRGISERECRGRGKFWSAALSVGKRQKLPIFLNS